MWLKIFQINGEFVYFQLKYFNFSACLFSPWVTNFNRSETKLNFSMLRSNENVEMGSKKWEKRFEVEVVVDRKWRKIYFCYFIMCGLVMPPWKNHHRRPIALRDENWVLMNVVTGAESERCCDGEQLTGSVDARWPYPSIVLPLAQNLIQNLFLFLTKIHFSVVGPVGWCVLWWCLIVWWRMIMKKIMKKFSSLCVILALFYGL